MTVQSTTSRVAYIGAGVITPLPIPFRFLADGDIRAIMQVENIAVPPVTWVLGVDYTLTGARAINGGTLTPTAAIPVNATVVIDRGNMQETQLIDYKANDPFPEESAEDGLDRLTMLLQQSTVDIGRSPTLYPTDTDGAGRYNANGNRIVNMAEGVNGTDAVTLSQVSGLIGPGVGQFFQGGAGAVGRSYQDKARESISVKDYGAVGDGTTNDAAAFNAAVAYLSGLGGGTIHIPRGDYRLDTSVQIANSGIYIVGEGATASACRIINGTTNQPAIQFGDGVSTYSRCGITNVAFGQASGVIPALGNCGLRGTKISNFSVEDIQVFNFPAAPRIGMEFSACSQMYLSDCGVQGVLSSGIYIKDNTLDLYANNCRSDANAVSGWLIEDSQGLYFVNCSTYSNTVNGWNLATAGADGNLNLFFVNCIGDTSGSYDWSITQCSVGFFSNCWGSAQQNTAVNTFATGFVLNGPLVNDITFTNTSALACNGHGMLIDQATRISIISPQFGSTYRPGVGNGKGSTGDGLKITANASHVYVRGGISTGNSGYALSIDSGATDIVVDGLYCLGNTLGTIQNSANGATAQAIVTNCPGFNPRVNLVTTPAFPATTVPVTNLTGATVTAYITGGTMTNISINGSFILSTTPAAVVIPPGANITMTYTGSPVWKWIAN